MTGYSFSFAAALFALPLAAVPILLHLLYRKKTPVVRFSTLRFVKLSVRRTAARRRVQKWLLLACRAVLVALLVWAVAQPVRKYAGGWTGGSAGTGAVAAVVVDTSYSMELRVDQVPLLTRADGMVQDLLRNELAGAEVAVFTSEPPADGPERLRGASAVLSQWVPLRPQPAVKPLADRVAAAVALLDRQPAGRKWLYVLSDLQGRDVPHALPTPDGGRTVVLDLHPADAGSSAGVTAVGLASDDPVAGQPTEVKVEVTGRAGDARAVRLRLTTPDGKLLAEAPPAMATPDATGRATVRFPVRLPAERFVLATAELTADDAMAWDNSRSALFELPPRQAVVLLRQVVPSPAEPFVRLALDPSEGKDADWPLAVTAGPTPAKADAAVAVLTRWPDARAAAALGQFAAAGHTLVLFLTPGMEQSWPSQPPAVRQEMAALLPSPPAGRASAGTSHAAPASATDPLLRGLLDEKFKLTDVTVRGAVPMSAGGDAVAVLNAVPVDPMPGARTTGLLFRRPVGAGTCYTMAAAPDPAVTNLATHPTFLPLLVRACLRPPGRSAGQNVELGHPVGFAGDAGTMQVDTPSKASYRVSSADGRFAFAGADEPGLYVWHRVNDPRPVAVDNVQLPAGESDPTYRPADAAVAAGPDVVVATDLAALRGRVGELAAADPRWSTPLAIVLFLLCLEALLGSWSKLWTVPTFRDLFVRPTPAAA